MTMESKKAVRVRLCFEEHGMLSRAQADQGLGKSWYLVNPDILTIAHLAARIALDYRLAQSCPHGVSLEMCGFVLPPYQSTRLLQDSDLVSVKRKQEIGSAGQSRELLTNSLSIDDEETNNGARFNGVELRALDEFEREAGGYQSEHSEDDDVELSLGVGNGNGSKKSAKSRKLSKGKESSGKKRKRSLNTDAQMHDRLLVLSLGNTEGLAGIDRELSETLKKKSSKKQKANRALHDDLGGGQNLVFEFERLDSGPRSEHVEGGVGASKSEKKKKKRREKELLEKTGQNVNSGEESEPRDTTALEPTTRKKRKVKGVKETVDLELANVKPVGEEKTPCQSKSAIRSGLDGGPSDLTPGASHERKKPKKLKDTNVDDQEGPKELSKDEKRSKSAKKDAVVQEEQPGPYKPRKHRSEEESSDDGNRLASNVRNKDTAPEQTNPDETKRPSRSARRKKAKKRWLREQAQNGLFHKEDVKEQPKKQPIVDESKTLSSSSSSEEEEEAEVEVEVEAEEEILPVMVAPGHIRFDRDEAVGHQGRPLAPVLRLSTKVRCKRQGQAWGQEKSYDKHLDNDNYYGRRHENGNQYGRSHEKEKRRSEDRAEQCPTKKVIVDEMQFEKLLALDRAPQVGDVLAYRLVELTASWTPELSAYRVGKVSIYDDTAKMVTLIPVPEYPMHVQPEDVDMDAEQDEDWFLPPYNADGTLEVDLATLMEVRVLEKGPDAGPGVMQATPQAWESLCPGATIDTPAISSKKAHPEDVNSAVAVPNEDNPQQHNPEVRSGEENAAAAAEAESMVTPELVAMDMDAAWQDILSQELNKKKLELAAKFSKQSSGGEASSDPSPIEVEKKTPAEMTHAEDGKMRLGKNGEPQIRHRHMRTGALGPTMALLRASQVL